MYRTAETDWSYCRDLHAKATGKPTALHNVTLARGNPLATTLVLHKNSSKERHSVNRDGQPRRCKVRLNAANGAKEMQIEESFLDLKSEGFGLGLNMHNTH
jgi:hypothetical protein